MRLAKLTISGFKSFARSTVLEFPVAISAIVGPNGSGKSNVAEAIRWVLGEQSLKTLRGKKGEDLIFNGSANSPRMGKAAVALIFANKDRAIPVDFDEVKLERKIFRDGANEYYLNDSQVRLKDIVELMARMGLGETKHNIISQGEVDHILSSSPRERREILEETIGLRLYQLKKREAERKLDETENNVVQVEALLKEIKPHLRFLKLQADRAEKREVLKQELDECFRTYITKEDKAVKTEAERIVTETSPATLKLKGLEKEITDMSREVDANRSSRDSDNALKSREKQLESIETERRNLERELGRIEGRLESERMTLSEETKREIKHVNVPALEALIKNVSQILSEALSLNELDGIKRRVAEAVAKINALISEANEPEKTKSGAGDSADALEGKKRELAQQLKKLDAELAVLRQAASREIQSVRELEITLMSRWQKLREREEEAAALRSSLQRLGFDKENLARRREELERVIEESGLDTKDLKETASPFETLGADELHRKIEKLKLRLEEIGGIDEVVLKEYNDTKSRHDFLERESGDLSRAAKDLRELISELEERIESDFKKGFARIKEEFQNYFKIIFGGGKGEMTYAPVKKVRAAEDEETADDEVESEYGIEIDVSLPRKKIKGLAMLSGGERTLVSIALLFAITAVNPPPFLILDETDAALDEANSQKYAALLKELSKKSQLVLVTHNRETMKQAGVLYGVTMGDDGISKILSLKLEEASSYGNR